MTVSSSAAQQTFDCDGTTTAFTCPFRVLDSSELLGFKILESDGSSVDLVNGVDFVVTAVGEANAIATTSAAYSALYQVKFKRRTARTQPVDYRDNDPFPAESHEEALDRLTHASQEDAEDIGRSLRAPDSEDAIGAIPSAADRALRVMAFDANGDPIVIVGVASDSAAALQLDLADDTSTTKGAYLSGYNPALAYADGLGQFLNYTFGKQAAETAAGVTPTDYSKLPGDVRRYGATGLGVTSDRDAIRNAIAIHKEGGPIPFCHPEDTYFVGTFANTTGENKFTLDYDGARFEPNGCKFTATANLDASLAAAYKQVIFLVTNASDVYIGACRVEANDVEVTGTQTGVAAVAVYNTSTATHTLRLGAIDGSKLMATLACNSDNPASLRHSGIVFDRLSNRNGYYTLNCANNGDGVRGQVHTKYGVRSYFVYGVKGHDVQVFSEDHNKFNDVLISRYAYDTSGIRVHYTCLSDLASTASVAIQYVTDDTTGVISNVDITLDVLKSNPANPTVFFAVYNAAGTEQATSSNRFDGIRIKGNTNSTTPIQLGTSTLTGLTGNNLSRLYIEESLLVNLVDYKRFIMMDGLTTRQMAISSAATSTTCRFNVSAFRNLPAWGRLYIWGADNATGSNANYFIREAVVTFSVASDGAVTIASTTTITTTTADPGAFSPGLTVAGSSAGGYEVSAQITGYTGANRYARAWLDIIGAQA